MKFETFLITLIAAFVCNQTGINAQISAHVSTDFLSFFAKSMNQIITKLTPLQIPDVNIDPDIPNVGSIHVSVYNTFVREITTDLNSARLYPQNSNLVLLGRFSCKIDGLWMWSKGPLRSSGGFTISANNVALQAEIGLRKPGAALQVEILSAPIKLGDLDIKIGDSKWEWLYNLLKALFADKLKGLAEKEIEKQMKTTVQQEINAGFRKVPSYYDVYKNVRFDFGLVAAPVVDSSGLGLQLKGISSVSGTLCPALSLVKLVAQSSTGHGSMFTSRVRPMDDVNKMVKLVASEPVINCLLWALHKESFFTKTLRLNATVHPEDRLEIDLKYAPTVELRSGGVIVLNIDYSEVKLFTHVGPSNTPFFLHLSVKCNFALEMHVIASVPSFSVRNIQLSSRVNEKSAENLPLKEFLQIEQSVLALFQESIISSFTELSTTSMPERGFPVPIVLPWPFNTISVKDFDIDINEKELQATMNMEINNL